MSVNRAGGRTRGRGWMLGALALGTLTCVRLDGGARDPDEASVEPPTAASATPSAGDRDEAAGRPATDGTAASEATSEPTSAAAAPAIVEAAAEPAPADNMTLETDSRSAPTGAPNVSAGPSLPRLLGATRRRVSARVGAPGEAGEAGWIHFGGELTIRFEGGRAVEVAIKAPAGLTCLEVARWAGFERAMAPIHQRERCAWPGLSDRHRLGRGVAGELTRATGVLHVWRLEAATAGGR